MLYAVMIESMMCSMDPDDLERYAEGRAPENVSQRVEEPNARSRSSFDENEGENAH